MELHWNYNENYYPESEEDKEAVTSLVDAIVKSVMNPPQGIPIIDSINHAGIITIGRIDGIPNVNIRFIKKEDCN